MKSHTEARFWKFYDTLPKDAQRSADKAYKLWQSDPHHPSLQFKRIDPQDPMFPGFGSAATPNTMLF